MLQTIAASELWQFPLGDELVVVRPGLKGLFLLNSTARLLWRERNRGASDEEAVRTFVDVFGVPPAVAYRDIRATLAHWSAGVLAPGVTRDAVDDRAAERSAAVYNDFAGRADAVTIDCVLSGQGFRVVLEAGDVVEEIAPRLARIAVTGLPPNLHAATFTLANGSDRVFVYRDGVCIAQEEKTAGARAILLQEMARMCEPGRKLQAILHAGACGTASGSVLLAGASHVGKSTLCAALMAHGLYCYSDDSAVIDREFRVAGMPFPLVLRKSSWPVIEPRLTRMERMSIHRRAGNDVGFLPSNLPDNSSPSAPVKALVFVEYQQDAQIRLEPLTAFDTLLALQRSGFWVEHERGSISRFLSWIMRLPSHRLTYSSLDEAIGAVCGLLG
jgi:hypothetical protein